MRNLSFVGKSGLAAISGMPGEADDHMHAPGMKYVVRPDTLGMPDAATALSLNCSLNE
jgi:hypothetical protein